MSLQPIREGTSDTELITEVAPERITLDIGGMTCAACANRVEKKLNRLDGVEATVNYATERANVQVTDPLVDVDRLITTVEETGYSATQVLPQGSSPRHDISNGSTNEGLPESRRARDLQQLKERLIISALLSLPVVILSMVPALQWRNWQWLAFAMTSPVVIWGGWPFHKATWTNLRHGNVTMDTLVSIGTIAAYVWSIYALFFGSAGEPGMTMSMEFTLSRSAHHEIYLEVSAAVITFILAGRYFEARAKERSSEALSTLVSLGAKQARLLRDGQEMSIPIEELQVGDLFVVRPGEKVATDGIVESGQSAVDNSLITGESAPVDVGPGDQVIGATINVGGQLVVRARSVGADTALAQMAQLMEQAQSGKAPVQRLADRVSSVFVPIVIVLAILTLTGWLMSGESFETAATAAVAVLIIACPCALGLATPTALLVGTGRGAQLGILIKGPETLESSRTISTVLLDKTGTVTTGDMELVDIIANANVASDDWDDSLLRIAALESGSEHHIARAVSVGIANQLGVHSNELPQVNDFLAHPGKGVSGTVDGIEMIAGNSNFFSERGYNIDHDLQTAQSEALAQGHGAVLAGWNGEAHAVLVVADQPKPTSPQAIAELKKLGLNVALLTGDSPEVARHIAERVGIDEYKAGVLPQGKIAEIKRRQEAGEIVAMVGDGVNDAPALAQADLGIAMGSGTDVAIQASDITIMNSDLLSVVDAIKLSRRTLRTIAGNLFWAFAYNVAALPLAALGFLNPMIAGAAMAFSSVFVVTNSLRLRGFRSVQ